MRLVGVAIALVIGCVDLVTPPPTPPDAARDARATDAAADASGQPCASDIDCPSGMTCNTTLHICQPP
jgi:hypothetical protein